MRPVLFLAALFLFTVPLTAQEPAPVDAQEPVLLTAEAVPSDAEPAATPADDPVVQGGQAGQAALVPVAAGPVVPDFGFRAVEMEAVEFDSRPGATMELDAAALQPDSRNWWWTVGAIVTAGVILAVLL